MGPIFSIGLGPGSKFKPKPKAKTNTKLGLVPYLKPKPNLHLLPSFPSRLASPRSPPPRGDASRHQPAPAPASTSTSTSQHQPAASTSTSQLRKIFGIVLSARKTHFSFILYFGPSPKSFLCPFFWEALFKPRVAPLPPSMH